ncbi:hypothetical protein PG996_010546 [Apiospora saccharicola]|uniref:FAD-binding PCMH-type domain-containing protein n=1 Tax=Apiospora saccharicola TaxID=335842 RepID=A0ABR1UNX0_9PEZI
MFGSHILPSVLTALALGGASVQAAPPAAHPAPAACHKAACPAALVDVLSKANGCEALQAALPGKTFFPGSAVYEFENQNFWSNTELKKPACVFRPTSPMDVSCGVIAGKKTQSPFAVRGGGHMGIPGANNIDNGVLMVMSNLTTLELNADKSVLSVGPAYRWGDVYSFLEPENLAVAGGRLSPVGVPGLLLAGGVNFHGNQHGWAADNVLEYEIVLADGSVSTANSTQNPDLFWALKGGSSNFGIVTEFKLRTFASEKVWAGTYTVSGEHLDEFFEAIADFAATNTDPKSHLVPMTVAASPNSTVAAVILFYDSPTVSNPPCFEKFLAIPSVANTCDFKTLSAFAIENGGLVKDHINDLFVAGTTVGKDQASLLKGIKITNDVFFAALPELYAAVPPANLSLVSIDWQPITSLWTAGSAKSNPGGNALGVDTESKGAYLAWAEVVEWIGDEYDDAVFAWAEKTTNAINDATKAAGLFDAFNYMGDAAGFQKIYEGYGTANEKRLLDVSQKYDPERVFQKLLPGGFKVGN